MNDIPDNADQYRKYERGGAPPLNPCGVIQARTVRIITPHAIAKASTA